MPTFTPDLLLFGLVWFVVFIFSTTLHEAAHAFAALRMGDPTAYLGGQVSLDPLPHIRREPFGMVVVPLLSFFLMGGRWMIGWASAPYDPSWPARHPRRSAWMALAGPAANLLLLVFAGVVMRIGLASDYLSVPSQIRFDHLVAGSGAPGSGGVAVFVSVLFVLNLVLFLFNLLPFPPMDGAAALQLVLPEKLARSYQEWMRLPMWGLVGLLAAWRFFPLVFEPALGFALRLLYG